MEENKEMKVKVLKNGPYQITGKIPLDQLKLVPNAKEFPLFYEKVKDYSEQATCYLCRCGKSKNKPFCDGSHNPDFDGAETAGHKAYEEMADVMEGKYDLNLLDAVELCAHARFCNVKSGVWNLIQHGFTEETREWVKQECADCPSGRLTVITKEGKVLEPDLPQEISILEDIAVESHGPIWVKGGIPIEDEKGKIYPIRNRVTLCRCGKSKNKPFCDGLHMKNKGELKEADLKVEE
jgi:CDGSH-type Zn-finger protein